MKLATEGQLYELLKAIVGVFYHVVIKADHQISSERAQLLIEKQDQLGIALLNALRGTANAVVSAWQDIFGHLKVWDRNFNEANYPLEPETDEVVGEYDFGESIVGTEAKRRLLEMGYSLPGPRACGKYVLAHPRAQFEHPLVGIGAEWQRQDVVSVPVFFYNGDGPGVDLDWRSDRFGSVCRFLVSRKPAQK